MVIEARGLIHVEDAFWREFGEHIGSSTEQAGRDSLAERLADDKGPRYSSTAAIDKTMACYKEHSTAFARGFCVALRKEGEHPFSSVRFSKGEAMPACKEALSGLAIDDKIGAFTTVLEVLPEVKGKRIAASNLDQKIAGTIYTKMPWVSPEDKKTIARDAMQTLHICGEKFVEHKGVEVPFMGGNALSGYLAEVRARTGSLNFARDRASIEKGFASLIPDETSPAQPFIPAVAGALASKKMEREELDDTIHRTVVQENSVRGLGLDFRDLLA